MKVRVMFKQIKTINNDLLNMFPDKSLFMFKQHKTINTGDVNVAS